MKRNFRIAGAALALLGFTASLASAESAIARSGNARTGPAIDYSVGTVAEPAGSEPNAVNSCDAQIGAAERAISAYLAADAYLGSCLTTPAGCAAAGVALGAAYAMLSLCDKLLSQCVQQI